jgi:NagD protein
MATLERASERSAYYIGKPNPLMMRIATQKMGLHSSEAYMVGDRMDTDIRVGMEAGMQTILVLSGVTKKTDLAAFPFRPNYIYPTVGQIPLYKLP